jgi:hypothetical protein
MGIGRSKGPSKVRDAKSSEQVPNYEDVELMMLRRTILRDPEMFILNNLMMCIQFFENYEE